MAKCPPGVICIENITIIFLIFVLCLAGFIWYKLETKGDSSTNYKFINIPTPTIPKFNSFYSTNPRNIFTDDMINIKASTSESLGFIGKGQGVTCYCIVSLKNLNNEH